MDLVDAKTSKSDKEKLDKRSEEENPRKQAALFTRLWEKSTMDNNLSLHGFRRFKTTHLVNLRYLEEEIAEMDHKIYQAGLKLGLEPSSVDRLGLKYSKQDNAVPNTEETINRDLILQLRSSLKEYDAALCAFNGIMAMESFSLADDGYQSSLRNDLHPQEICKTRLVRTDLGPRSTQDPFQRQIQKTLRALRFRSFLRERLHDEETTAASGKGPKRTLSVQNSILIASVIGRFLVATITAAFLIIPLVISSYQNKKGAQLWTIGISVLVFALLVSVSMHTSNHETMALSSAYAAVLSVVISNGFV